MSGVICPFPPSSAARFPGPPRPPGCAPRALPLGVTSRARSRPAAGGRCTAAPPSRVPGAAGLRAPEHQRFRLPAGTPGTAPTRWRSARLFHAEAAAQRRGEREPLLEAPGPPLRSERSPVGSGEEGRAAEAGRTRRRRVPVPQAGLLRGGVRCAGKTLPPAHLPKFSLSFSHPRIRHRMLGDGS